jgi:two-component system sensor histidine kinase HydH
LNVARLSNLLSWLRLRRIDLVWLLVMAALAAIASTRPRHSPYEFLALALIAVVQVCEMRFSFFSRRWGAIALVALKVALAWFLVGVTDGIESRYYLVFLLPIVSAASALGLTGTLVTAVATSAAYYSFLVMVWDTRELDPDGARELGVRILFFFMTGIVLNHFITENRRQVEGYRKLADDLAQANRELSQAQAQVRRTERLAALGQLSAGLAHELRNPLGVIRGSAELLSKNVASDNAVAREMAGLIAGEVDRTNALVTRFLEFARPLSIHRSRADLRAVIEQAWEDVRRGLPPAADHRLEANHCADLGPFSFDAELMERVFFNLFLNGVQAMPKGGAVTVATRCSNGFVETEVSDTGTGIAPENLEAIFNPFFTTKPEGVGLGLAIVSKIVDDHGGKIAVSSEPGRGTTFRVTLPFEEAH